MTIKRKFEDFDENEKKFSAKFLEDKWKLVPEFLKSKGLMKEHTISFSNFLDTEIKNIVRANSLITTDVDRNWYFEYTDVRVGYPSVDENIVGSRGITPFECRIRDMTYSAPINVDVKYIRNGECIERKNLVIGKIPIMLRSSHCVLYEKTEEEMVGMSECPLDPGGYFIVKGVERVLLIQEQMMNNRMILDKESDGSFTCSAVSSTHYIKSRTCVLMKNEKFYVKHSSFVENIPVMVVFKGMGLKTDQEVAQLIGIENDVITAFTPSIESCYLLEIRTQKQALNYMASRIKQRSVGSKSDELVNEVWDILCRMILAHVPVVNNSFRAKIVFLALMVRRIILAQLGLIEPDDRDYYGNKRLEMAGSMVGLLFEDLFKRFNFELKKVADKFIKLPKADKFDAIAQLRPDIITLGLANSIGSGNWTIKRFNMHRVGVTQVLSRLSYISAVGMMTRINSLFEKTRKVSGPRSLQPSQWGMICPSDTPEGEGCGLVKNFALLSHVTSHIDEEPLLELLENMGVECVFTISREELSCHPNYTVFLNGHLVGVVKDWIYLTASLRYLRQTGVISEFISISTHQKLRYVLIATDGGRMCRPYIVVENGVPAVNEVDLNLLVEKKINFEYFVKKGMIEYLDVNEENDALIAINEHDLTMETTHIEIEPFSILGVCSGLIPYPHHNQSPRNSYQCAMGKQAMGFIAYNQHKRMDTLLYSLAYSQVPLVKSKTIDIVNYDKLPAGQNAIVAVMSFSGYDIEDALIVNKASLDRGFGRCLVYRRSQVSLKNYATKASDRLLGPAVDTSTKDMIWRHSILDGDGICFTGASVENRQILVNKSIPVNSGAPSVKLSKADEEIEYKDTPLVYKGPMPSYVDKVVLTSGSEEPCLIKVLLRQTRRPEIGDKFSSRHGQKGVIGMIFNQEDMPFNEQGICPDIIMNPHGFPSRMTVGKLIELLAGKAGVMKGELSYATAFQKPNIEEMCKILESYGFNSNGKDLLINGKTGEIIPAHIYMGPIYYQKLKHMVVDKMHARSRGPRAVLTHQPTEGRSREGGLRLGEMERDCLIGYGASMLILERLMISSDLFSVEICENCGLLAGSGWCQFCRSTSNITELKMPYAFKLLLQELQSMNVVPRIELKNYL